MIAGNQGAGLGRPSPATLMNGPGFQARRGDLNMPDLPLRPDWSARAGRWPARPTGMAAGPAHCRRPRGCATQAAPAGAATRPDSDRGLGRCDPGGRPP